MAAKTPPDYLNLPFEIHFNLLWARSYEFIHEIGKNPKSPDDYIGVVISDGKARGVSFRSENAGSGALTYVLAKKLDEFIPAWLEFIEDTDFDVKSEEIRRFRIVGDFMIPGAEIDADDLDGVEYDYGPSINFYACDDVMPAFIVLDADNSRVVVDADGYMLAEDDTRIGKKPLVAIKEDSADDLDLLNRDEDDIKYELAQLMK